VLITAGPTFEAIDPVRGITNLSSGKMGYAIAQACVEAGAEVTLVSGPTALQVPVRARVVAVKSAGDMAAAVDAAAALCDVFIAVAAVADYTPTIAHASKMKKAHRRYPATRRRPRQSAVLRRLRRGDRRRQRQRRSEATTQEGPVDGCKPRPGCARQ
jgi:phosphopantothenoylcysteine synthetase/decarboxylase